MSASQSPTPDSQAKPHFRQHVFFCLNQREDGKACCMDHAADRLHAYAKQRSKELKIARPGGVRMNKAGCLDRCAEGPVLVIYPEGVWYSYHSETDIEEIIQEHILNGRIVERLRI